MSDGADSSSSFSTSQDSDSDSDGLIEEQVDAERSCSYDKTIYWTGIAVEKVPNSDVTVLQWLAMNFFLFTSHPAISKSAFSDSLNVQNVLKSSKGNDKLPTSYKEARAMIEPYVVKKKIYKFCINNCVCFRHDYADLKECPVCHSLETKRYIYLPVGPRLQGFLEKKVWPKCYRHMMEARTQDG